MSTSENSTQVPGQATQEREADGVVAGPGVVTTRSQRHGALGGILLAGSAGAAIGLIVGLIAFEGTAGIAIATIAFAVAGAVFGGVFGGFLGSQRKMERSSADV